MFNLYNHITGKVYELTQENMTQMIVCIDKLRTEMNVLEKENVFLQHTNKELRTCLCEIRSSIENHID